MPFLGTTVSGIVLAIPVLLGKDEPDGTTVLAGGLIFAGMFLCTMFLLAFRFTKRLPMRRTRPFVNLDPLPEVVDDVESCANHLFCCGVFSVHLGYCRDR